MNPALKIFVLAAIFFTAALSAPKVHAAASCTLSFQTPYCSDNSAANGTGVFKLFYSVDGTPEVPSGTFYKNSADTGSPYTGNSPSAVYGPGGHSGAKFIASDGTVCSAPPFYIYSCALRPKPLYKRVFVTNTGFTASQIGGLDGADGKCTDLAHDAGLGDKNNGVTWQAWLSSVNSTGSIINAKDRFRNQFNGLYVNIHEHNPYLKYDKFSSPISDHSLLPLSNSFNDLLNLNGTGHLIYPQGIAYYQNNILADSSTTDNNVWTATGTNGNSLSASYEDSCNGWTGVPPKSQVFTGKWGHDQDKWTYANSQDCTGSKPLYCFEQ